MTLKTAREVALDIARLFAKAKPESYYSEPFKPHEWVLDALEAEVVKNQWLTKELQKAQLILELYEKEGAKERLP